MKVRFNFLTGDVNWSQYGGTWISQKFNNSDTDYWLVREIINWEERGQSDPSGKYTVMLSKVCPSDYSQYDISQAMRFCFGDDGFRENTSEEVKVEALYDYGCYIQERSWNGNNYSILFQECQNFANAFVEGDKAPPPVDFSKLPQNLLVLVAQNRFGHLEGEPKSDRHDHNIAATNIRGETSFYIQEDYNVSQFIENHIPVSSRKGLDRGFIVVIRMRLDDYLGYLPAPVDEYSSFRGTLEERKSFPAPDAAVLGGIKQPEPGSLVLGGLGDRSN